MDSACRVYSSWKNTKCNNQKEWIAIFNSERYKSMLNLELKIEDNHWEQSKFTNKLFKLQLMMI